jgi:hypothetical protein
VTKAVAATGFDIAYGAWFVAGEAAVARAREGLRGFVAAGGEFRFGKDLIDTLNFAADETLNQLWK